jgi:hypothetical protein
MSHYRIVPVEPSLISTQRLEFAMDYGYFTVRGSASDDEPGLVARALAEPPTASDGKMVVVLSPHQNNFALPITVEAWTSAPVSDRDAWQQVSEDSITVGAHGSLYFESPTLDGVACPIGPGDYVLEVSGRGFMTRGWPGSTEPGDEWRVRVWPRSSGEPSATKGWDSSVRPPGWPGS